MEIRVLATIYALIFVGIELIWLVTIRNRHVIIISGATILVGAQGLWLILIHDRFSMGNGYLIEYLGKLLAIDVFFLLSLWVLFYKVPEYKSHPIEHQIGPLSFLAGFFLYISSVVSSVVAFIITSKWLRPILVLLIIMWCIITNARSCSKWPDG